MTITSYAQNFEDVMLWRALKHIDKGCYVDIGAQHPIIDSVSKVFYEHGWRGVHVEPVPKYSELLRQDRPDDTVLEMALSDIEGTLELNVIAETGLSTAVDIYAERHHAEYGFEYQRIEVQTSTLKSALHSLKDQDVHWLKIDVEGFEHQVIKGWDSKVLRPWIMVVEATIPNSTETDYASWDSIVIAADYQFVYFDGLNRFYVAKEHAELVPSFALPPNIFDELKLTSNSLMCSEVYPQRLQKEKELTKQLDDVEGELHFMQNSRSWKVTVPLRFMFDLYEERGEGLIEQWEQFKDQFMENSRSWYISIKLRFLIDELCKIKSLLTLRNAADFLISLLRAVARQPFIKELIFALLDLMPNLKHQVLQMVTPVTIREIEFSIDDLSPQATQIYAELKQLHTIAGKKNAHIN